MTLIQLKNGPIVSAEAIGMALKLDEQGYTLRTLDGKLRLSPRADARPLTEEQKTEIAKMKAHLMALADYQGDPTLWDAK